MSGIDRFNLVDQIGRELQSRMTYTDIDVYLKGFGVDCQKETSNSNSKWVYTKELLGDEPLATIVAIGDDLGIPHPFIIAPDEEARESTFWLPGYFRLFLSHLSSFKRETGALRDQLRNLGISAFVAHTDIEPTKEWQREIENALFSMDALAAILTPGFQESDWTDQEVGVAIGRGVLVVPIIKGVTPYGLFGKYQGLTVRAGTMASSVAQEVFNILVSSPKSRPRLLASLISTTITASEVEAVKRRLAVLAGVPTIPEQLLEQLRAGLGERPDIVQDSRALPAVNRKLAEMGAEPIGEDPFADFEPSDDDLPF